MDRSAVDIDKPKQSLSSESAMRSEYPPKLISKLYTISAVRMTLLFLNLMGKLFKVAPSRRYSSYLHFPTGPAPLASAGPESSRRNVEDRDFLFPGVCLHGITVTFVLRSLAILLAILHYYIQPLIVDVSRNPHPRTLHDDKLRSDPHSRINSCGKRSRKSLSRICRGRCMQCNWICQHQSFHYVILAPLSIIGRQICQ